MHDIPRSEHPFPQMSRSEWLNLNGVWEFAETDENEEAKFLADGPYPDKIKVPFCRESVLSGLGRKGFIKNVWYRRTFDRPSWRSQRVRLHIGACDWQTRVWVNGQLAGEHKGGSAAFAFDVTNYLKSGKNTVIVHAYDDTRSGLQACGKQSAQMESHGCHYTRTTGIWQTVWLEGIGSSYIKDCHIQPDPDNSRVVLEAEIDGPAEGLTLKATALAGSKEVGSVEAPVCWRDNKLVLDLSHKRLWSVEDPFLYDLKLALLKDGKPVDSVDSYFGLRDIKIKGAAVLINGKPVFQRTVLDQGFYPDGIWTAPSDDALRGDIELSQAAGFNGARLHQKVFEPRFLYWADKLGYLVWGEFPNWGLRTADHSVDLPVIDEWAEIVRRDRNHPSVVGWCPFNETPGDAVPLQNTVVNLTRLMDPARPVIDTSGWTHGLPNAEVMDAHDYDQNPETFRARWCDSFTPGTDLPGRYRGAHQVAGHIPFFVSEYGGIGWNTEDGWGYGNSPKTEEEFYTRLKGLTDALMDNRYMFGFSYTQLTDVEQEKNGIYFYSRKPKFDMKRIHAIFSRPAACEKDPPVGTPEAAGDWQVLVGAFPDGNLAREWRYTMDAPADGWTSADFSDSAWKQGLAGFGKKGGWEGSIRTPWETKDIWLRQEFTCDGDCQKAILAMHYDNDTEIYVNGKLIWTGTGWNDRYDGFEVTKTLKDAVKPGRNVIAIHCHQDEGGQFIDAALLVRDGKK